MVMMRMMVKTQTKPFPSWPVTADRNQRSMKVVIGVTIWVYRYIRGQSPPSLVRTASTARTHETEHGDIVTAVLVASAALHSANEGRAMQYDLFIVPFSHFID